MSKDKAQSKPHFKSWRPKFSAKHAFTAVTKIKRLNLESGDAVPHDTPHATLRVLFRKRRIGFADHPWTHQKIEAYKSGEQINDFAYYDSANEARKWRSPKRDWPSALQWQESAAEAQKGDSAKGTRDKDEEPVAEKPKVEPKKAAPKKAPAKAKGAKTNASR